MRDGWEILTDWSRLSRKATRMVEAMIEARPPGAIASTRYRAKYRGLMLYGPGSREKLPMIRQHVAAGGVAAMWDMGYWDRRDAMRLSIDGLHPTPAQLDMAPAGIGRRQFELREDGDASGPVLLIGLGPKSVFAYDIHAPLKWEMAKLRELKARFPGREIRWRPKGDRAVLLDGTTLMHGMPIEDALRGCSLVVSHHSNCSVDACIAGVRFETEVGAATWFQGRDFNLANRSEFLERLSWWEWSRFEAAAAWRWIESVAAAKTK